MSETMENVIVLIVMVAIVIGLLCFVGYGNIKEWLCTPFVWKEQDIVDIEYRGALEIEKYKRLIFSVYNSSEHIIDDYTFQVVTAEGISEFTCYDATALWGNGYTSNTGRLEENGFTTITFRCDGWKAEEENYAYLEGLTSEEIQELEYRVVELKDTGETLFRNHGWWKVITILAASLVLGLLGFVERLPVWLRIGLKACGLPCLLVVGVFLVIFASAAGSSGSSSSSSSDSSASESAKKRYKRAASLKAGAIKTGSVHNAAKAQEEMDKAMADMIAAKGSGSSAERAAAERYKRAASHKAGAVMTGRTGDAARSQAEMDRAMADMINKK